MSIINLKESIGKAQAYIDSYKKYNEDLKAGKDVSNQAGQFKIGMKEANAYNTFLRNLSGDVQDNSPKVGANLREMITSTDVIQMVPHVIEGQMIEAAEPEYLFANLFNKVQAPSGGVIITVPVVGEIFVTEVGEAQPYNEDAADFTQIEQSYISIRVKKFGAKVSITEEAIADYTWDVYNLSVRKLGRAFGRFREEKCMNEATKHGHIVFDNDPNVVAQHPELQTTGRGKDGARNNTLSVEDFLDMVLASITNDHVPTDCFMHPLTWVIFARNSMIGAGLTYGALGGQNVHPFGGTQGSGAIGGSTQSDMGNQSFVVRPEQVNNRLPIPLTMNLTPHVNFDKEKKLFDMYVVDRNDIGVIAEQSPLKMDNWTDPERDIRYLKASERYGVGISGHGKGIMVARNLSVAETYPESIPVHVIAE